jgi:hypothetical protein
MFNETLYNEFQQRMESKYPEMFATPYGGFAVGSGWWPIIEALCSQVDAYTKWRNNTRKARLEDNPHELDIPDEVPQVVVMQIKEKFGGLRFYYTGGDEHIRGMVTMAESWASHTCEQCGSPGTRRSGGWLKTLCDQHDAERKAEYKKRFAE